MLRTNALLIHPQKQANRLNLEGFELTDEKHSILCLSCARCKHVIIRTSYPFAWRTEILGIICDDNYTTPYEEWDTGEKFRKVSPRIACDWYEYSEATEKQEAIPE